MARSRSDGDSKQGLTVALVLAVLMCAVLGLMAYFGYADQRRLEDEKKLYEAQAKQLRIERDRATLLAAVYQTGIGMTTANKKEGRKLSDELAALRNAKDKRDANDLTHAQAYEDAIKRLKNLTWDPTDNEPKETYVALLELKQKQADTEIASRKKTDETLEKANKEFQNTIAASTKAQEAAQQAMKDTKDEVEKRIKTISDSYNKVIKAFDDNILDAEGFAKELNKLRKEKEEIEGKLQAALTDAERKIRKMEEKIPQIDILAYDQAKGKVARLEGTSTAYINLGKADLLRTGLTFSVFGVGAYRPNAERKASLEVIDVIGDHLAKARITEVRGAARDPVLTGDLLYNPAWSPGFREHVAVAGLIDLTGDGRDGTQDFVRMMDKMGVAVDVYLDTREIALKGKGMSRQTGYLIIGEIPEFQQQEQIKEGDVRQERKISINQAIGKMRDDAIRMGVTVVPARRFLALMGFKLPRSPASADDWNAYTFRPQAGGAPAAPGKGEPGKGEMPGPGKGDMPGKDAMKKDEMKKDEK